ncbi:MAG: helix-hairpin-helix domain-containing protein [Patescibacteria group bacterium]|jgi:competence protein ComEA
MGELLQRYKLQIGLLLVGLILIGVGVIAVKYSELESETKIEVISGSEELAEEETVDKIIVEISGEVLKPGVYELDPGSRVNDLLIVGGGLIAQADREWVGKNINLAQKLADGVKIYIPRKEVEKSESSKPLANDTDFVPGKININIASIAELDSLWGIGEATAKKIIEARPFQKPEELLEKKIVKSNVWEAIKDQVSVY